MKFKIDFKVVINGKLLQETVPITNKYQFNKAFIKGKYDRWVYDQSLKHCAITKIEPIFIKNNGQ